MFDDHIKDDKHQVFLLVSPATFPVTFANHTWFVTSKKGEGPNRWEIRHFQNEHPERNGYLYKNLLTPWEGMEKFKLGSDSKHEPILVGVVEGDDESTAHEMIKHIEEDFHDYEHAHKYSYAPGPNCNTYTQKVLDKFPDAKLKLPRGSFGKSYNKGILPRPTPDTSH